MEANVKIPEINSMDDLSNFLSKLEYGHGTEFEMKMNPIITENTIEVQMPDMVIFRLIDDGANFNLSILIDDLGSLEEIEAFEFYDLNKFVRFIFEYVDTLEMSAYIGRNNLWKIG